MEESTVCVTPPDHRHTYKQKLTFFPSRFNSPGGRVVRDEAIAGLVVLYNHFYFSSSPVSSNDFTPAAH